LKPTPFISTIPDPLTWPFTHSSRRIPAGGRRPAAADFMVHTLQSGVVECLTVMTAIDGHAQDEEDRRWQKIQGDEIVCPSMFTCVACVSVIASSVKRRHQKICWWKDLQLPAAGRRSKEFVMERRESRRRKSYVGDLSRIQDAPFSLSFLKVEFEEPNSPTRGFCSYIMHNAQNSKQVNWN